MTEPIDPNRAVDYIIHNAAKFAAAKAERCFIEEYRKSKKALLMGESTAKSAVEREQHAYASDDYIVLLHGLKAAIETEERLKWELIGAQLRVDIWRSQEASNRNQDRVLR